MMSRLTPALALHGNILLWTALMFFLGVGNIAIAFSVLQPQFVAETCTVDGKAVEPCALPLFIEKTGQFQMKVTVRLSTSIAPQRLRIIPDECLRSVSLNGQNLSLPQNACDYGRGHTIEVFEKLREGDNDLVVNVENRGGRGGMQITVDSGEMLAIGRVAAMVFWSIVTLGFFLWLERRQGTLLQGCLIAAVILGCLLRLAYFIVTPHDVRGHDFDGHLDYTQVVANTWLPPAAGWQAYQPPLYYYLAAPWFLVGRAVYGTAVGGANAIQAFSLLLSCLALGIGAWIAFLLLPRREGERPHIFFVGLLAVLPSLVLAAPRINNDALALLIAFTAYGLLLLWYRKPRFTTWMWLGIVLGLGMLAKSTTVLMIALAVFCLLCHGSLSWKTKAICFAQLTLIVFVVCGWFVVPRMLKAADSQSMIVGNVHKLTNFVKNDPEYLLTLNPLQMVAKPYNNPYDDAARRQYFWEYFYHSALLGEFQFGNGRVLAAQSMIVLSLFILILSLIALVQDTWKRGRDTLPLWSGVVLFLVFAFLYRVAFPYSSSQDFRYVLPMMIPLAYYAAVGIRRDILGYCRMILTGLFLFICAGFMASLYIWPL